MASSGDPRAGLQQEIAGANETLQKLKEMRATGEAKHYDGTEPSQMAAPRAQPQGGDAGFPSPAHGEAGFPSPSHSRAPMSTSAAPSAGGRTTGALHTLPPTGHTSAGTTTAYTLPSTGYTSGTTDNPGHTGATVNTGFTGNTTGNTSTTGDTGGTGESRNTAGSSAAAGAGAVAGGALGMVAGGPVGAAAGGAAGAAAGHSAHHQSLRQAHGGQAPAAAGQGQGHDHEGPPVHGDADYEWLADLLDKMWPYVTEAVNKEAAVQLPDLIKASKPTWMGAIDLHKFKLGGAPPALTDIRVIKDPGARGLKGDEYIHLEMDFDWDSSQDVELDVSPIAEKMSYVPNFLTKAVSKATSFRCGVENFEMFGQLMLSFRPLMHQLPVVGGLQVCFTEPPDFDFDITLGTAGAKILDTLPALKGFLYGFISDTLLSPYVLPDHYFYPLDPAAPDLQVPVGYVEVEVVEAKNIPAMDYLAKTSPYVEIMTHKRGVKKTKVGDHHKHPTWNETFKMPINTKHYQRITAVLWDEDMGGDDEVGRAMFPVRDLTPNETKDVWLDIKPLLDEDKGSASDKTDKKKEKKRDRMKKLLTKPIGPPDPQHKGTALHLRMTYRELKEEQVRAVLEAEQEKKAIMDPFMKDLLAEDTPSGVVAGDRAQQNNPTPTNNQEAEAASKQVTDTGAPVVKKDKSGTEVTTMAARPTSADPEIARKGEESGLHTGGPPR